MKKLNIANEEVLNWIADIQVKQRKNNWDEFLNQLRNSPEVLAKEIMNTITLGDKAEYDVTFHFEAYISSDDLNRDIMVVAKFLKEKFLRNQGDQPLTS